MGFFFLSLLGKNIKCYTYINVIRVKNENCEFLQNLWTDFLVTSSVETPWMFTVSPKTKKIHLHPSNT